MLRAVERGGAERGPAAPAEPPVPQTSGRGLCVLAGCWEQGEHEREKASAEVCAYGPGVTWAEELAG